MLLALLPLAGFALTLDGSKFTAPNIDYGTTSLPAVSVEGDVYATPTDYTVVTDKFYTSNEGAGETPVASLKTTANGQYFIKVLGAGSYDGQVIYVDFWIKGVPVTIDFDAVAKTFGEKDEAHPITYALTKKGAAWNPSAAELKDLGLTVSRAAGENVKTGGYAYSFEWTNKNYTVTRVALDADVYTINPKNISASAKITAWQGNVVYTGNPITGAYTVKDGTTTLEAGKDYTVSTQTNVIAEYKPTITFKGNYAGSIDVADGKGFKISPAPIVVGLEDIEVVYDGTDKADQKATALGKLTYAGFVGADLAGAAALKTAYTTAISGATTTIAVATEAIDAKDYDLVITTNAVAGGNYYFAEFVPGKLTIKQAPLAIKADNATKSIGEVDPAFKLIDYAPLTITGVTFTRESGETAGEYKITPVIDAIVVKKADKNVTANYKITVDENKGKLTIGKTKIYVSIKDAKKFYGADDPVFEYTVTGLKGEDKLAAFTITREAGEHVGAYSLTATVANPKPEKYSEVIVANGIFTIKKAQLELTFTAAQSVKLNPTAAEKTAALKKSLIKVAGINNSDKADDLYKLSYKDGVEFDANKTYDDGVVITLDNTKKLLTENATDYVVTDLYEIVTNKATDPWTVATTTNCKLIVGDGTADPIAFTTAATDADYNLIKAHAGEVQNVTVTLNRRNAREVPAGTAHPWKKEIWNTMVLPFEVTVAELSTQLGYAVVNVVNPEKTTEGNVAFKLEMQKIPANTPFCVKTSGDIANATVLTFAKKLIVDGGEYPSVDAGQGYKFFGAYKDKTIDKNAPTLYFMRGDIDKWAHIGATSGNSWTVVPFDAYIDLSAAAAPEMVTFTFEEIDGSVTAIKAVEAGVDDNNGSVKNTGWYSIDGMKLDAAPTKKGIYIKNGKKFVVK